MDLKSRNTTAGDGMTSACRHISRWKAMTVRNMRTRSIRGMEGKTSDGRDADEVQSGRKLCEIFHIAGVLLGERVFISFQGAESGMALWLNGAYVGYSEDSLHRPNLN